MIGRAADTERPSEFRSDDARHVFVKARPEALADRRQAALGAEDRVDEKVRERVAHGGPLNRHYGAQACCNANDIALDRQFSTGLRPRLQINRRQRRLKTTATVAFQVPLGTLPLLGSRSSIRAMLDVENSYLASTSPQTSSEGFVPKVFKGVGIYLSTLHPDSASKGAVRACPIIPKAARIKPTTTPVRSAA